ncbi:hypothetical protein B0H15DRAFT_777902, partial [Mycena belliarum]
TMAPDSDSAVEFTASILATDEAYWRDRQLWLEECGYMLRPRFRPDWVPSWRAAKPGFYEDQITLTYSQIIDATRIADGARVVLKRNYKWDNPNEAKIFAYLSSPELASDPRNHCIPLLEQLSPPDDEDAVIFVMKLLRDFQDPRFDTFGEVVEFFRQIFEGLQFMHHHRVAHRDCNFVNTMMDAEPLFPRGFHPVHPLYLPDIPNGKPKMAKPYTRTQRPVKYYFIDFGISAMFKAGQDTRIDVIEGGDHSPPEFGTLDERRDISIPVKVLDPFPTDIYYLGNLIRWQFIEFSRSPKHGFGFMEALVADMIQDDPAKRPNIDEVVARFEKIMGGLSSWKLRSRVVKKTESPWHLIRRTSHLFRRIGFIVMRVPAIPPNNLQGISLIVLLKSARYSTMTSESVPIERFTRRKLTELEVYWRDHQLWLKECGYELRPRYQHDWVPACQLARARHKCQLSFGHVQANKLRLQEISFIVLFKKGARYSMASDSDSSSEEFTRRKLLEREVYWRDHQLWLKECGYELRPRYQHDWVPSWAEDAEISVYEDGITLAYAQIMDATRIADGACVVLKRISKSRHPNEAKIFAYFSSAELVSDPRNHCIPLLGQLSPPDDDDIVIFVMQLLREFANPRFDTFGEVVEFFRQIFEGLQFMHHHRVAHRDCNLINTMMDANPLYPHGFHPVYNKYLRDMGHGRPKMAKHYTRTQRPVRYYFIDFGLSAMFEPGQDTRIQVIEGGDHTPPEFGTLDERRDISIPVKVLDPFPTDIYYLGNLIKLQFIEVRFSFLLSSRYPSLKVPKHGFGFMEALVADMVQDDPAKRPNIDEVVARFEKIMGGLSSWKLRSRVVKKTESPWHLIRRASHLVRRIRFIVLRVPAIPRPKPVHK